MKSGVDALRKSVEMLYRIVRDTMSHKKEYKYIVYRGDLAVAKFKLLEDAETFIGAASERHLNKLMKELGLTKEAAP